MYNDATPNTPSYQNSDLRFLLNSSKYIQALNVELLDYIVPFSNGDFYRIPHYDELFDLQKRWPYIAQCPTFVVTQCPTFVYRDFYWLQNHIYRPTNLISQSTFLYGDGDVPDSDKKFFITDGYRFFKVVPTRVKGVRIVFKLDTVRRS